MIFMNARTSRVVCYTLLLRMSLLDISKAHNILLDIYVHIYSKARAIRILDSEKMMKIDSMIHVADIILTQAQ